MASQRLKLYGSGFARPEIGGVASLQSPDRRQPSCSHPGVKTTLDCIWKLGSGFKSRQSSRRHAVDHEAVPGGAIRGRREGPAGRSPRRSNWPKRRRRDMVVPCEGAHCPDAVAAIGTVHVDKVKDYFGDAAGSRRAEDHAAAAR